MLRLQACPPCPAHFCHRTVLQTLLPCGPRSACYFGHPVLLMGSLSLGRHSFRGHPGIHRSLYRDFEACTLCLSYSWDFTCQFSSFIVTINSDTLSCLSFSLELWLLHTPGGQGWDGHDFEPGPILWGFLLCRVESLPASVYLAYSTLVLLLICSNTLPRIHFAS